jgi:tetratricopeptide (TPR) repeat protein
MAWVLSNMGFIFLAQIDFGQAADLFQQSLREAWHAEECPGYGWALVGLGEIAQAQGDLEQASALYSASLALFQESRDTCSCSSLVTRLAQLAQQQGNDELAGAAFTQGLVLARAVGHQERATLCLEGVTRHNYASGGAEQVPWPYGTAEMERAQHIVNFLKMAREEGHIPQLHALISQAKTGCD